MQKGLGANLRVRWALYLYLATVAVFLLTVVAGISSMMLTSGGFSRGVTLTGAGGILGSLTLLLKGPISRFYDNAVAESKYENIMVSRERNEDRLRRNWENISQDRRELEFHFWLERKEDERQALESWRGEISGYNNGSRSRVRTR